MSYTLKYRYSFKSFDDNDCRVDIYIKDAAAGLTILNPAFNPFILKEYNSDDDFFKPTRGFIAEMNILSNNVSMDDFLNNEDDGVQVQFYFNGTNFWTGWLMQDDFEENWIDTNHVITLRATDGIGTIASEPMTQVVGHAAFIDYIGYALEDTPLRFLSRRVVCNLFYDGMADRADGEYNPLDQVTIDGKTFEGDDRAKVLEKVMRAWSMTVYQWRAQWYVARLEEWLTNNTIYGLEEEFLTPDVQFSNDYEVNIGVDEDIKPIMPEMLRSIKRPSKRNKITFYYRFPDEIICNQTFLAGDLIVPTTNNYEIDCWTLYKTTFGTLTAGTADTYRVEEVDGDGNVTDNYMFISSDAALHYNKSTGVEINSGDTIRVAFDYRAERNVSVGPANIQVAAVLFETGTDKYTMDDDGEWVLSNSSYTTNFKFINMSYSSAELLTDWKNREVTSKAVPGDGTFYVCLVNNLSTDSDSNHKGLEIEIREASKQPGVIGDYDLYTLPDTINQNYEEEIFMDDSNNKSHKGAIQFNGDLTGDNWYRMDFPTERLTFKRHKAIAHMFLSKRYRQRLQVNMLGNTWLDGATVRPIWLQNKFVFVDDAPNKKFMITNLSEMNFQDATWKANLIEVWDSELDDNDPDNYPATHSFANIYEKDK
jgi:hypothetical protein